MENLTLISRWVLFLIATLSLMFVSLSTLVYPILGVDKSKDNNSSSSISNSIHKSSNATMDHTKVHNQIEGIKILRVHTKPSTVYVGEAFNIEGVVINNSTDTITFPNGTCNSPVSLDFDKNVLIENRGIALCTMPTKEVILKPHGQSGILTTNNSGIVYKATSPGMTNATISLNFGVKTVSGKSPASDNISRVYTFNITNHRPATTATTSSITAHHIRGIKVLQVQTMPSTVAIGGTFSIQALVINNSSSTITFSNGTCNEAIHINFNKNISENPANSCAKTQKSISLKPGERTFVVSGVSYKAGAPGITNATIVFNYGVQTANGKSTTGDNTTRTYAFDIHKTSGTGAGASASVGATHYHIKGVKVLHVHTIQPKVYVGSTFSLKGTVINNSTATITFANGTCISPLSVTFDKNVVLEHHITTAKCKAQQVSLKPNEQSPIVSPKLSGIVYKAIAPGTTNATMLFKYKVLIPTSKSPISDNTSRTYSFNIQPTTTTTTTTTTTATSTAGPIKITS